MHRTLVVLLLAGCSEARLAPGPDDVVSRIDLSAEGDLVGVAVEPDSGRRLALVSDRLFVLDGDTYTALDVQPELGGFTDVVALGDGKVALSMRSNGYLFDTVTGALTLHFCYEPGWEEWDQEFQITHSLGFDIDRGLIVAQPRTATLAAPDDVLASFVSTYVASSGTTEQFYTLPETDYRAGGMSVPGADQIWLATDDHLDSYEVGADRPKRFAELSEAGVVQAEGLAIDDVADTVLVADVYGEVIEIRRDALDAQK